MKKLLVGMCALAVLVGCSSSDEVVYVEPVSDQIDIFYSEADVGQDYFVMTELNGSEFSGSMEDVRASLIREAEAQGADAIVFFDLASPTHVVTGERIVEVPTSREIIVSEGVMVTPIRAKLIRYK